MLVIGLTGGIGSGKSTVCNRFTALDIPVIDADEIAHELVEPGQPGLDQIIKKFGRGILTPAGGLDRPLLRKKIFADGTARSELERILHPLIREHMKRQLATLKAPYVILAIPLLIETRQNALIDRILVVDAEERQQIARVSQRDGLDKEQIERILAAQCSRSDRLAAADDVIYNSGGLEALMTQVDHMNQHYLRLASGKSGHC